MEELTNPQRLLERMQKWASVPRGQTIAAIRLEHGRDWWDLHAELVGWVIEFEGLIAGTPFEERYETMLPKLREAIFAKRYNWANTQNDTLVFLGTTELALLGAVVDAIDDRRRLIASVVLPESQEVRDLLLLIRELVNETADLTDEAKQYLLVLVGRMEEVLAEVTLRGTADIQSAADQLIGALSRLFVDGDGKQPKNAENVTKRFRDHINGFLNSPVVCAILGGVATGLTQITTGQ